MYKRQLTDNAEHPEKVRKNIIQVALDYLACGIDPEKSTIFIQSMVPELTELTFYYMNLVTVARVQRNPTVKSVSYTHLDVYKRQNDIYDKTRTKRDKTWKNRFVCKAWERRTTGTYLSYTWE